MAGVMPQDNSEEARDQGSDWVLGEDYVSGPAWASFN